MFFKPASVLLLTQICSGNEAKIELHEQSFDDAIKALRGSSQLAMFVPSDQQAVGPESSLVETQVLKKPLSVAQFSEWLHNLYFNEQQKRDSAIKSLLDNDPLRVGRSA